ncbi:Hsp20/alpha crystallin family protein [Saccharopolyspora antimicrobica]|uniref:HSP20 family protein n=1 Tax=Saccharopolyspora antimicrobica TaxID=455193 RepID=A0A1I5B1X1_9PSEU|nr:Hsp20/alpha crystallin family protein [Saccharopolyspora antimicrobica]RKT86440.1 HSP20 family protein [Saccharopolyspora antimicrobica]SFN68685.1 HSP20 family protein [Saccharopolyspora antimicrobica]
MLQFDPFRDFSRLANEVLNATRAPQAMPMDVYRLGDHYVIEFDLPGVDPDSLDLITENNTLTVRAERKTAVRGSEQSEPSYLAAERPRGTFSRQLMMGEGVNLSGIAADYKDGVLTVTVPVAEEAKPRRVEIGRGGGQRKVIESSTEEANT